MSFANQQSGIGCTKYAYLYNEEDSKKKLICKNGSVFPDKCSKHPVDISVCDCDINCGCVKQCNRMKCVNGQDLFLDGCNGCEPKCKIDCRDRKNCISGKYKVNAQGNFFWSFNWYKSMEYTNLLET